MPVRIDTNQPSVRIVLISLALLLLAVIGHIARVPYVTPFHFWIAVSAYAALLAGALYKI